MKKIIKIKELIVVGNINDNIFHKWKILDEENNYIYISGFYIQNLKNKLIELYNLITNNNNNNIGILCNISYSDSVKKLYLTDIHKILDNEQLLKYKENEQNNQEKQNQKNEKKEEEKMDNNNLLLKNGEIKVTSIDDILSHENIVNIYKDINKSMEGVVDTINDSKTYWQGKTTIDFYSNILKLIEITEKNKYFKEKNALDQEKMNYDNNMYKYYTEKLKFDKETLNLEIRKMSIKLAEKVIDDFKFKNIDFMDKMLLILKIGSIIERSMNEGMEVGIDLLENIKEKLTISYIKQEEQKEQEVTNNTNNNIEIETNIEKSKRGRKKKTEHQTEHQILEETKLNETKEETKLNETKEETKDETNIEHQCPKNENENNNKNNIENTENMEIKKSIFSKKIIF